MASYIDVDEFYLKLKELYQSKGWDEKEVHFSLNDMLRNLTFFEPADVRENVRGEWVGHPINDKHRSIDKDCCSICGERFYQIAETGCVWKFCPHCGAEMRHS